MNSKNNVIPFDFQIFLSKIGIKEFLKGFYYFKWLEYSLVFNKLKLAVNDKYLDIGSGKSIFPLFCLCKTLSEVNIIDDCSIITDSIEYYNNIIDKMYISELKRQRFFIHRAKGTKFNFSDNSFDKISCISVIEHIENSGDSQMMKTIFRILKPGGKAILTFPFNNGNYIEENSVGYFQRRYNVHAIKKRIINASELKLKETIYFGERFLEFGNIYSKNKLSYINSLLPLFSKFLWRICHSYKGDFRNYHENELDKKGIGVACLVMEK